MSVEWMPRIVEGNYPRAAQDSGLATLAPKVEKSEAELSFERPVMTEYARFRAFTPSPGATLRTSAGMLKLSRMGRADSEAAGLEAGTVLSVHPLVVRFADGALEIVEVQPEGNKRMSGKDCANGQRP